MENALIEMPTMRCFNSIKLINNRISDKTTILLVRHLLENHDLGNHILVSAKALLSEPGLMMDQ